MVSKSNIKIEDVFSELDSRITKMENVNIDNRELLIKLITQTNQIVKFLSRIEIEEVESELIDYSELEDSKLKYNTDRINHLRELLDSFDEQKSELEEFEEELKKVKAKITPGQFGES